METQQQQQQYITPEELQPLIFCTLAARGDLAAIKAYIEDVEKKGGRVDVSAGDYDNRTPLHVAAEEGKLEVAKLFIQLGADVHKEDRWAQTPLHCAFARDHHAVSALLKENGASFRTAGAKDPSLQREKLKGLYDQMAISSPLKGNTLTVAEIAKTLREESGFHLSHHALLRAEIDQFVNAGQNIPPPLALTRGTSQKSFLTKNLSQKARQIQHEVNDQRTVTWDGFCNVAERARAAGKETLLERAMLKQLVIHDWKSFCNTVSEIFDEVAKIDDGHPAAYIPELAEVDPNLFGVSICTVDGQQLHIGDCEEVFSLQSTSKPLLYSYTLEDYNSDYVHQFIGREPSGARFNAFSLNSEGKPHNACINAGAIVLSALFHPELTASGRWKVFAERIKQHVGGDERPGFAQAIYLSEKDTAHTNIALAHFMAAQGSFPILSTNGLSRAGEIGDQNAAIEKSLDFYFQVCSTEMNCTQLAVAAGLYANNGVHPLSGVKVLSGDTVKKTMQMLFSCGMYDYSGEWACSVGVPAKSGVSGVIFLVIPNVLGMAIFSPPLDRYGNSVRGVEFAKRVIEKFQHGIFDVLYRKKEYDILRLKDLGLDQFNTSTGDLLMPLRSPKVTIPPTLGSTPKEHSQYTVV